MIATTTDRRDDDRELAARVAQRDHGAFTILFERYKVRIYRFAHLMVGNEKIAEDLYQEVFINFYKACVQGTAMSNVQGYLLRSVRNRCLNIFRQTGRQIPLDEATELSVEMDPGEEDLNLHLQRALESIPPHYREAFLLFAVEGYTYREIADQVGVSLDVVRNRIFRAKQSLQKMLRGTLGE